ncbi:hypothetical protein FB451DRAFT_1185434 [Mycena latifolia]|nr:hypothetical protein FB451DRAFT_1185434 [Mycena latifolia]
MCVLLAPHAGRTDPELTFYQVTCRLDLVVDAPHRFISPVQLSFTTSPNARELMPASSNPTAALRAIYSGVKTQSSRIREFPPLGVRAKRTAQPEPTRRSLAISRSAPARFEPKRLQRLPVARIEKGAFKVRKTFLHRIEKAHSKTKSPSAIPALAPPSFGVAFSKACVERGRGRRWRSEGLARNSGVASLGTGLLSGSLQARSFYSAALAKLIFCFLG